MQASNTTYITIWRDFDQWWPPSDLESGDYREKGWLVVALQKEPV